MTPFGNCRSDPLQHPPCQHFLLHLSAFLFSPAALTSDKLLIVCPSTRLEAPGEQTLVVLPVYPLSLDQGLAQGGDSVSVR